MVPLDKCFSEYFATIIYHIYCKHSKNILTMWHTFGSQMRRKVGKSILSILQNKFALKCLTNLMSYWQTFPWVVPLGTTLAKSQESWTQFFYKSSIYLYIGLFDWTTWAMFSPPMHTLMKNNDPKTYNMHWHFDSQTIPNLFLTQFLNFFKKCLHIRYFFLFI